jgi:hypothetical protein
LPLAACARPLSLLLFVVVHPHPPQMASEDTFLFTSESVNEGHPGQHCTPRISHRVALCRSRRLLSANAAAAGLPRSHGRGFRMMCVCGIQTRSAIRSASPSFLRCSSCSPCSPLSRSAPLCLRRARLRTRPRTGRVGATSTAPMALPCAVSDSACVWFVWCFVGVGVGCHPRCVPEGRSSVQGRVRSVYTYKPCAHGLWRTRGGTTAIQRRMQAPRRIRTRCAVVM